MTQPPPRLDPERWEERYVEGDIPWDTGRPDTHLQRAIDTHGIRCCHTLEVGCGTGTNTVWLAQLGFDVLGIDVSPTAIRLAQAKAHHAGAGCALRVADFLTESIPEGPFDWVQDRGVFHLFEAGPQRQRFVARVAELLTRDGLWHSLIGSTDGPPRDSGPPRRTAQEILTAVEPLFDILELRATRFDDGDHAEARAWTLMARKRALR